MCGREGKGEQLYPFVLLMLINATPIALVDASNQTF